MRKHGWLEAKDGSERERKAPRDLTRAATSGRLQVPLPGVAVLSSASCSLSWYHHTLHPSHYLSLLIKFPLRSKKPEFLAPTGWEERRRRSHHRLPKRFQDEMRHEFQPTTYKSPKKKVPHLAFIYLLFFTGRPTPDLPLGLNYILAWPYLQPSCRLSCHQYWLGISPKDTMIYSWTSSTEDLKTQISDSKTLRQHLPPWIKNFFLH